VPVEGTVTLDGKPLAGAVVTLMSETNKDAYATAMTEGDGTFQLMTRRPADGAAPGDYKVLVSLSDLPLAPESHIGISYEEGTAAGRRFLEMEREYHRTGKRPAGRPVVPAHYGDPSKTPLRLTVVPGPPMDVTFELHSSPSQPEKESQSKDRPAQEKRSD
jgi:hypothetical protein